ncbi:acetyl-CoA carboxylase biotin carboxyl carrier protein [Psychrobacter sp. FDAARGOS_221]|uniref:acetyl-CoA carboxylase biotin carboxyl carrier protein n=1 Tax=Psychrobacter sp. FDAARGOS_221 TaxID=1975705 RepID=UPI000BB57701|nr:acetyl-CoA carboxylase biotin carboxyl carrier protein [Psychrobacter sp. FDAARGOS_221]PNK60916.1 acetyl-CoA carboxylase biotin carboxyl carrier protein [Psychrobacter sp. FDAARGOS_221]
MNINFDDVEKIIALAERSDIESLEVVDGEQRIHVVVRQSVSDNSSNVSSSTAQVAQSTSRVSNDSTASQQAASEISADTKAETDTAPEGDAIVAPMMGTFYLRSEPSADVFVNEGDSVSAGDTLCVIEAMKIMHEVKAESDCVIDRILITEGDVVDFGQKLFETHSS